MILKFDTKSSCEFFCSDYDSEIWIKKLLSVAENFPDFLYFYLLKYKIDETTTGIAIEKVKYNNNHYGCIDIDKFNQAFCQ
jgi:hypothetical protein